MNIYKNGVKAKKIPAITEAPRDIFYSSVNMNQLRKSEQQFREGKVRVVWLFFRTQSQG